MARAQTADIGSTSGGGEGERLQEAASGLVDQAARTAEAQASTTMTRAGDTLDLVARAIRDAGGGLREQQPQIADIADAAAQKVQDASRYLRDHQAGEVIENAQSWARQQPAIVIGGGLAIGLLLGRFLKSGSSGQGGGSRIVSGYGKFEGYGRYGGGEYAGHGADPYGRYGSSATGYAAPGATGTGLGGSVAGVGGTAAGYETSSAGYAGGGSYGTGALAGDALGSSTATSPGGVGGVATGSTLDQTSAAYAPGAGDPSGLEPNVSDELEATDAAASEALDATGEEAASSARPTRRRRS